MSRYTILIYDCYNNIEYNICESEESITEPITLYLSSGDISCDSEFLDYLLAIFEGLYALYKR